jgi:hypothetical protein
LDSNNLNLIEQVGNDSRTNDPNEELPMIENNQVASKQCVKEGNDDRLMNHRLKIESHPILATGAMSNQNPSCLLSHQMMRVITANIRWMSD